MRLPVPRWLWIAFLPALVLIGPGCSGINTSHSVSPASFFIPGLNFLQTDPKLPATNAAPAVVEPSKQLALAR